MKSVSTFNEKDIKRGGSKNIRRQINSIEKSILVYFLEEADIEIGLFTSLDLISINIDELNMVAHLRKSGLKTSIEGLGKMFELLTQIEFGRLDGVVFTPKRMSDFIVSKSLEGINSYSEDLKIIDPSCGYGMFLISAIEYLEERFKPGIESIIKNNIYGLDILDINVKRSIYMLEYYSLINGLNLDFSEFNKIGLADSLRVDWANTFGLDGFDFVIGNPPYVNTRDMLDIDIEYYKSNYSTMKSGSFNLFHGFIEKALEEIKDDGRVSYIIPNSYIYTKSGKGLRSYLKKGGYVEEIIDLRDNIVFDLALTYSSISCFSKNNKSLKYTSLNNSDDLYKDLQAISDGDFISFNYKELKDDVWVLRDPKTIKNIRKIESFDLKIGPLVKTGIATLKDGVYLVNKDDDGFYKDYKGKRYRIDKELVLPVYKASNSGSNRLGLYIIYPYKDTSSGATIIPEEELVSSFGLTHKYLKDRRGDLDKRDGGKPNRVSWYAYGRSQGLSSAKRKIVFPTFCNKPNFKVVEGGSLVSNGYFLEENDLIDLDLLVKILNSSIMDYYIKNTSYQIDGGYYCCQKRFIENFSVPNLSEEDKRMILSLGGDYLENYLIELYGLVKD